MSPAPRRRRRDVPRRDVDLEVVLVQGATEVTSWPLGRAGRPDLAWVEALARLQVAARRLGCSIRLRGAGSRLRELAHLWGLTEQGGHGPARQIRLRGLQGALRPVEVAAAQTGPRQVTGTVPRRDAPREQLGHPRGLPAQPLAEAQQGPLPDREMPEGGDARQLA